MDDRDAGPDSIAYEKQIIKWAHTYNGYRRLAGTGAPGYLRDILMPVLESYSDNGTVPAWAGVDLLRGWAFYLVRINRHEDGYLFDEHPEMCAVADAVANHPDAVEADLPPPRSQGVSDVLAYSRSFWAPSRKRDPQAE